jgi:hypothetical protein
MAHIRKIQRALLELYRPILTADSLDVALIRASMLDGTPIKRVIRNLWLDIAPNDAERTWLQMMKFWPEKSLGKHSLEWISLVRDFLSESALDKLTTQITESTRRKVSDWILEATAEGNGIEWLTQRIEETYVTKRARVIARTETVRARNAGYLTAADKLPFQAVKVWNSARDTRTRRGPKADHYNMNGQTKEVHEYFQDPDSGALMMAPGDSSSSTVTGADVINCRCRVTFIAKRGPDGLPLRK